MMSKYALFIIGCILWINGLGQKPEKAQEKVYKLKRWVDGPLIIGAFIANDLGRKKTNNKPRIDSATIVSLNPNDINWFDRGATRQDASYGITAAKISDYGMNVTFILPALLALDKEIREDWFNILMLYLETAALTGDFDSWVVGSFIDRNRPLLYNPDVPMSYKRLYNTPNSFYSGHVASTASASFLMAKVYSDYHPELGIKKYLFYAAAAIPPTFVGIYRYKAGMHYLTDIISGLIVGASFGILVPHLHKIREPKLVFVPVSGPYLGMAMSFRF